MNKYCQIHKGKKNVLFVIDTISELQFIEELIFIHKFDKTVSKICPEILFLKSTFSDLLEFNSIYSTLQRYFNEFQHIILNVDFSINIQILSSVLYTYNNISTHYPVLSNNFNISYKKYFNFYNTYNIKNIKTFNEIKLDYIDYSLINKKLITYDDIINDNIYNDFYKIFNIKSLDYKDNLNSIEREIIKYLLTNNIQNITIIEIYHGIYNKFHRSISKYLINKIKIFIETYAYNNILNIFIPKTYIILYDTDIYINQRLLNTLFINNIYIEFKTHTTYFSLIPLVFYSSRTCYQYKLKDYIKICIQYLKTKSPIKFQNIPLQYESQNVKIKKEEGRVKIILKHDNNILYSYYPKLNNYKALKTFSKYDPNIQFNNNQYIFSKPIHKNFYINYNKLSYKILFKNNGFYTLSDLINNYEIYTKDHLLNIILYLEFLISIKFIQYLSIHSFNIYLNVIYSYFVIKFNNKIAHDLNLIFPYDSFFTSLTFEDDIFNHYKTHNFDESFGCFFNNLIKNYDILILTYENFWIIINEYATNIYVYYLEELNKLIN